MKQEVTTDMNINASSTIRIVAPIDNLELDLNQHYAPGGLLKTLLQVIATMNKTPSTLTIDDLAAMDEFHAGGREATQNLMASLPFKSTHHLLDIGCGLGGSARFVARQFGAQVTGFDLTDEFIEVGQQLNKWVGLQNHVTLEKGNVLELPLRAESVDGGYMIHVGMNIENKASLFTEVARVLKPGAFSAIYDLMRVGSGNITFPVPWSGTPSTSFVTGQDDYLQALTPAGFQIVAVNNRHTFALDYFDRMQAKIASAGPEPLGLHLLMGDAAAEKLTNAYGAMQNGTIAPVEIITCKKGTG
jgi:ubiquinone/menaquinone biosynthesis C-methylase UbiE